MFTISTILGLSQIAVFSTLALIFGKGFIDTCKASNNKALKEREKKNAIEFLGKALNSGLIDTCKYDEALKKLNEK